MDCTFVEFSVNNELAYLSTKTEELIRLAPRDFALNSAFQRGRYITLDVMNDELNIEGGTINIDAGNDARAVEIFRQLDAWRNSHLD